MFVLWGYGFMGGGVGRRVDFRYGVFVRLVMLVLLGEKGWWVMWVGIVVGIYGVCEVCLKGDELWGDGRGVIIVVGEIGDKG